MHCTTASFSLVVPMVMNSVGKANIWQAQCIVRLKGVEQNTYSMLSLKASKLLRYSKSRIKA